MRGARGGVRHGVHVQPQRRTEGGTKSKAENKLTRQHAPAPPSALSSRMSSRKLCSAASSDRRRKVACRVRSRPEPDAPIWRRSRVWIMRSCSVWPRNRREDNPSSPRGLRRRRNTRNCDPRGLSCEDNARERAAAPTEEIFLFSRSNSVRFPPPLRSSH